MNYQLIYNRLIQHAQQRDNISVDNERHHIIPDCFFINRSRKGKAGWLEGDPNSEQNIVYLTPREHFVAHLLLAKIYGGNMVYPAFRMSNYKKYSSRQYEWLRKQVVDKLTGREVSQDTRKKISLAAIGRQVSDEVKNRISEKVSGEKNPMFGRTHTKEVIDSMKEKLKMKVECPHCGKSGGMTIMQRWHFDNCKLSPTYIAPPKMKRKSPSEETVEKIKQSNRARYDDPNWSNPLKGKKMQKDHQCKYCGLIAGKGQISRWHNENCKQKDVQL